jgi:hypothetical protein
LRGILAAIGATLERLREHFPLTLQGVFALGLALMLLRVLGYGAMDLVVFALAVCAIAILVFCLLCVIIGGVLMQFRVRQHLQNNSAWRNLHLEAGFPNESGFDLQSVGMFPLIRVSWRVIYPDYIETRVIHSTTASLMLEELIPLRRCRTDRLVRLFTVSDVLGLCQYRWRQAQSTHLLALPRSNTLRSLPLLRSLTAEDGLPSPSGSPEGDRVEIRPYVPGDSVRNIMWKVYARTRELNVRLPERSVFHSNRTLAYLLSGPDDEAAAAVARVAVESGVLGDDWAFSADGTETPCSEVREALEAIAGSRAIDTPYAYGLDNFLTASAAQGGTHCIVFAAAKAGPWIGALKQTIGRYKGRFSLVLATDGFVEDQDMKLWQRLVFRDAEINSQPVGVGMWMAGNSQQTPRADLTRLLTEVGQLVESTLVVDRSTGHSFDQRLRKV